MGAGGTHLQVLPRHVLPIFATAVSRGGDAARGGQAARRQRGKAARAGGLGRAARGLRRVGLTPGAGALGGACAEGKVGAWR